MCTCIPSCRCSSHAAYCLCAGQERKGHSQARLLCQLTQQGLLVDKITAFPFSVIEEAEAEAAPEPSKKHRPKPTDGVQVAAADLDAFKHRPKPTHGVLVAAPDLDAFNDIVVRLETIEGLIQLGISGGDPDMFTMAMEKVKLAAVFVNDTIMKLQMPAPHRPTPARLAASKSLATLSDGATVSQARSPRSPAGAATPADSGEEDSSEEDHEVHEHGAAAAGLAVGPAAAAELAAAAAAAAAGGSDLDMR